jgi:hypothetical protein
MLDRYKEVKDILVKYGYTDCFYEELESGCLVFRGSDTTNGSDLKEVTLVFRDGFFSVSVSDEYNFRLLGELKTDNYLVFVGRIEGLLKGLNAYNPYNYNK